MTLEKWNEYPKRYDVVNDKVFFDELKVNLVNVIHDYADLGVRDEDALKAQARKLLQARLYLVQPIGKVLNLSWKYLQDKKSSVIFG